MIGDFVAALREMNDHDPIALGASVLFVASAIREATVVLGPVQAQQAHAS